MSKLWKCHVRATEDTGQWIGLTRGRIRWIFPSRVIPISNDKRASSDRLICWRGRQGRTDLPKVKQILQVSETCFGGDPRQFDKRVQRWLHRHRQLSGIAVLGDSLCGPRRREHSSPYPLDNREVSFGGKDTPKPEPGSLQQLPELRLGALSATWSEHQHLQIQEFAEVRPVAGRDNRVDD